MHAVTTDVEPLMDVEQLAAYLRVHANSVYRLVRSKRIPHVRMSRKTIRFRKADIDRWLSEQGS